MGDDFTKTLETLEAGRAISETFFAQFMTTVCEFGPGFNKTSFHSSLTSPLHTSTVL
jgi:hypothetical protein